MCYNSSVNQLRAIVPMNIIEWFQFHGVVNDPSVRNYLGQMTAGEFLSRLTLDLGLELEWESYIKKVFEDAKQLTKNRTMTLDDRAGLREIVKGLTKSEPAQIWLFNIGRHLVENGLSLEQSSGILRNHYVNKGLIYTIKESE